MNLRLSILLTVSLILRFFAATLLELGNDEVYYMTYAMNPDWSHFDHPPMVGWFIQLFSLNLMFDSEWVLRLSSLVFGIVNIIIIHKITFLISNERVAFISALLASSSIFLSVICGIFILPDTPLMFFWLSAVLFFTRVVQNPEKRLNLNLLFAGLCTGLAMLSKYQAVFLWVGFGMFVLLKRRSLLRKGALYLSLLCSVVCLIPVLYWNFSNDFISFTFHSGRVSMFEGGININTLFQELGGSLFYNNIIIAILIWIVFFKQITWRGKSGDAIILYKLIAGPLIATVIFFSLWRQTLPHWTAPAFTTMIPVVAIFLSNKKSVKWITISSTLLTTVVLILGTIQIRWGLLPIFSYASEPTKIGKHDFTLDMYGWKICEVKLAEYIHDTTADNTPIILISHKWFPSAHFDFYVARPLGLPLLVAGDMNEVHKFAWLNAERITEATGIRYIYLTDSHNFKSPQDALGAAAVISTPPEIFPIYRNNTIVKNVFVYEVDTLSLEVFEMVR